jgi:hypothetical protein
MGDFSGEFIGSSSEASSEGVFEASSGSFVEASSDGSSAASGSGDASSATKRRRDQGGDEGVSSKDLRDIPPR